MIRVFVVAEEMRVLRFFSSAYTKSGKKTGTRVRVLTEVENPCCSWVLRAKTPVLQRTIFSSNLDHYRKPL